MPRDPEAVRVRKKPVPVQVHFAESDGVCRTREGEVDRVVTLLHGLLRLIPSDLVW